VSRVAGAEARAVFAAWRSGLAPIIACFSRTSVSRRAAAVRVRYWSFFHMVFISNAYAQGAGAGGDPGYTSILFMVVIFVVFYFLLIRPQTKRQKEHKAMIAALNKGDEVVTAGGIAGKILEIDDQYLMLQIASVDGKPVSLSMQRVAVQTLLPKGTLKSI
jgi:preprotein translocase subunit YajC